MTEQKHLTKFEARFEDGNVQIRVEYWVNSR